MENSRKDSDIFHSQFSITVLEINNEQDYKNCGRIRCRTAERGQIHADKQAGGPEGGYRIEQAADHAHAHYGCTQPR